MKRVYVDMDGVLCDYWKRWHQLRNDLIRLPQTTYGFYTSLEPIKDAISSYKKLEEKYDVWILTRPSFQNPMCYTEKRVWVEKHLGIEAAKKMIICWNKGLLIGDYLIDDTLVDTLEDNLQSEFTGEFIHFGSDRFKSWTEVKNYLNI